MPRTVFVPNPTFAGDYYQSGEALELVDSIGGEVADRAAELARKRLEIMADSISHSTGVEDGRATARVRVEDFKGGWWEFGTSRFPADPFLRPAAEQVTGQSLKGGRR